MNPGELKPGMLPTNMQGGVPIIGAPRQMQVMISHLCVNCFPKVVPAPFLWFGNSLCSECFTPHRKNVDNGCTETKFISGRDYKKTWGNTPEEEKLDGKCY